MTDVDSPAAPPPPPKWPDVRPPGSGPATPLTGRDRRIARVELMVIGFAVAAPGLVLGLRGFRDPTTVDLDISILRLIAAILGGLGPAAIVIYLLWRDGHLPTAGLTRPRTGWLIGRGLLVFISCVGALFVVAIAISIVMTSFGIDPPEPEDEAELAVRTAVAALLISLMAGVGEEIVYRAYAITRMEQAGWPRAALYVPVVVWTAEHLYQGLPALIVVGTLGAVFVAYFNRYRNVYPLIIAHALYDLGVSIISLAVR